MTAAFARQRQCVQLDREVRDAQGAELSRAEAPEQAPGPATP